MCRVELFMVKKEFITKQSETNKWLEEERRSLNYTLQKVEHELKITKEVMDSIDQRIFMDKEFTAAAFVFT